MVVLFCAAAAASASADRRTRAAATVKPPAPSTSAGERGQPSPGSCSDVQPGVKVCWALADGHGAFDVVAALPAVLFVRTDEPIVHFIPPDPHYFQADKRDTSVVIAPVTEHLPETTPTVITTQDLTITLRLHPGHARDADTQLTIRDPSRPERTAELIEAVAQAEKRTSDRVLADARGAELEAIARGVDVARPRGRTIARNSDFAVLEATAVVRIGDRRFVLFSVENRGGQPFHATAVRLKLGDRPCPTISWKLERPTVAPAGEARGVVELPRGTRSGKLTLIVDELDLRRSVELQGVELR
jgi:hypothetical protein